MRKFSRQREIIKASLKGRTDHPTAEMIYADITAEHPNISKATVYRNLNLLVEEGELARLDCGDGVERFDPELMLHMHYFCKSCGLVRDLPWIGEAPETLFAEALGSDTADSFNVVIKGICHHCMLQLETD